MDGPASHIVNCHPEPAQPRGDPHRERAPDDARHAGREGHGESPVADLPAHRILTLGDQMGTAPDDPPGDAACAREASSQQATAAAPSANRLLATAASESEGSRKCRLHSSAAAEAREMPARSGRSPAQPSGRSRGSVAPHEPHMGPLDAPIHAQGADQVEVEPRRREAGAGDRDEVGDRVRVRPRVLKGQAGRRSGQRAHQLVVSEPSASEWTPTSPGRRRGGLRGCRGSSPDARGCPSGDRGRPGAAPRLHHAPRSGWSTRRLDPERSRPRARQYPNPGSRRSWRGDLLTAGEVGSSARRAGSEEPGRSRRHSGERAGRRKRTLGRIVVGDGRGEPGVTRAPRIRFTRAARTARRRNHDGREHLPPDAVDQGARRGLSGFSDLRGDHPRRPKS